MFSAGLTVLQVAYSCTGAELKLLRTDQRSLVKAIEQLSGHYSQNLVIILLLMLQWDSLNRPDFVTLEALAKNEILGLKDPESLKKLTNLLMQTMEEKIDTRQFIHGQMMTKRKKAAEHVKQSKTKEIYKVLYPDIDTFLGSRKKVIEEEETNVKESFSLEAKHPEVKSPAQKPSEHDLQMSHILIT